MSGLLRSEVLKLTSSRTARWLIGSEVLLVALLLAGALVSGSFSAATLRTDGGYRRLLEHGGLTTLLSLVLGVLIGANEFRHHTITDTFLSAPRRDGVVVAKLGAAAVVGLVGGVVSAAVVVATAAWWYARLGMAMPVDATLVRGLAGLAGWHIAYALLGVALGLLLRSPAAAIVVGVVWISIAETALAQIVVQLGRWLPATACRALGGDPEPGLLPQGVAALVLLAWAATFAAVAAIVIRRRDVA